ncbi:MAG: glycosyltransferase family 2 protein [Comamonadaceae bacterium]|nr:MAG: glycosyltransferase family 2 protein [Comamonadaceae bacterium]
MPTVLIIVPCYNSAAFLSETIESVLRQELQDWEMVLVDDGSRDATWEVITRYAARDPRIIGFQKPNEGTTKARNFGFASAGTSSRYVTFLDHDDQWEPDAMSRVTPLGQLYEEHS